MDSFSSLPFSLNLNSSPGPSQWGESSTTSPANSNSASVWTEKERNLLREGLVGNLRVTFLLYAFFLFFFLVFVF